MAIHHIRKLQEIAAKPSRIILGLMSGTSLDGLDMALCRMEGSGTATRVEVLEFETRPYPLSFKNAVLEIFARPQGDIEKLVILHAIIGTLHGEYILDALARWNRPAETVDCIASHGQTIYHAPKRMHLREGEPNATLQIGDGDHLAVKTGIITLSDFRQKHIAAGGEGAPLALYGDLLLFSSPAENRILLNMGGIANFTFLPASGNTGEILSTDTGPGNTLIDACMRKYFDRAYDHDGLVAASGQPDETLLNVLLEHPFFNEPLPKTTGPELFGLHLVDETLQRTGNSGIAPADLVTTLTHLTAISIARAIRTITAQPAAIYLSGGGCHNPMIVKLLEEQLPGFPIRDFSKLGVNPDAKEAVLFAVLANETLAGEPISPGRGAPAVTMGKISLPA